MLLPWSSDPGQWHLWKASYIKLKLWDWVLRHQRQLTQLRSSHVINLSTVGTFPQPRTKRPFKVNYFECLHLSQDCDIFAEASLWSTSTIGGGQGSKTGTKLKKAMYVINCYFVSISCKLIFWRYWRIIENWDFEILVLFFLQSLSKPLVQSPRQDHLYPLKSCRDQGRLG